VITANAVRYFNSPVVQHKLSEVAASFAEVLNADRAYFMRELHGIYELNKDGSSTAQINVALKALDLMMDLTGVKAPAKSVNVNVHKHELPPLTINFVTREPKERRNMPHLFPSFTPPQQPGEVEEVE
jgi:hypothetical protein